MPKTTSSIEQRPPRSYFNPADLASARRRIAAAREAAELEAAELDAKHVALALTRAIAEGTVVMTDGAEDGTSELAMTDGSDLEIDEIVNRYASADEPDDAEDDGS
jgi:hypothetical protein